jgi:5'-nucleotidase
LTNDDGIESPGLLSAHRALRLAGHEVVTVAPDGERSGQSHSVNLRSALRVKEVAMPGGGSGYGVDGSPADCAHLGCLALAGEPIDLVVSGINTDTNLGYDANYSGTVGAALEAAALGYPALAASLERSPAQDWELAGQVTLEAANLYQGWGIPRGVLVNLNIPAEIGDPLWVWAPLNLIPARERYAVERDAGGRILGYRRTRELGKSTYMAGSDVDYFRQGRITLSPVGPVRSERKTLARLQNQGFGNPAGPDRVFKRAKKSF